jgi:hypothetical protein
MSKEATNPAKEIRSLRDAVCIFSVIALFATGHWWGGICGALFIIVFWRDDV